MGTCQSNATIIHKAAADSSCSTSSTAATSSTDSTARMKSEKKAKNITGQLASANNNIKIYSFASGLEIVIEEIKRNGDFKTKVVHFEGSSGKAIEEVYSGVHDGPVLGTGISGVVRLATHEATGVKYAVKCLDLGLIGTADGLKQIREEIHIMCQLDHPNIVRLEEVYEGNNEIFLVQELCSGGELFDRLDDQPDCHFTEKQCVGLVKQMLSAVRYMHSNGIVHRDLKLENFLFSTASPESELKMIDFGLSKHFTRGQKNQEPVGTPYTVAPEVLRGNYDEKVDVWAIGVITYLLLCGDAPFGGCGGPEPMAIVRKNILEGSVRLC
jgi:calcium-dependent protein kinase